MDGDGVRGVVPDDASHDIEHVGRGADDDAVGLHLRRAVAALFVDDICPCTVTHAVQPPDMPPRVHRRTRADTLWNVVANDDSPILATWYNHRQTRSRRWW